MRSTPEQLDALMKRCQVGHAKWGDLNNLLAECYGAVGGLRADLEAAEALLRRARYLMQPTYADEVRLAIDVDAFLAGAPAAPPESGLEREVLEAAETWYEWGTEASCETLAAAVAAFRARKEEQGG